MFITLQVEVQVEKTSGKFLSKDDIVNALIEELEGANPDSVEIDDSEYEITDWTVNVK